MRGELDRERKRCILRPRTCELTALHTPGFRCHPLRMRPLVIALALVSSLSCGAHGHRTRVEVTSSQTAVASTRASGQGTAVAGPASIWEVDETTSAGQVVVAAPPASVYAAASDYAAWRELFSDVIWVEHLEGGREDGLVRFKSRALGKTSTLRFENVADELVAFRMVKGPPGARARGRYTLTADESGKQTTIDAELYLEATGLTGVLLSDEKVRNMRRAKLRADLDDLAAYFGTASTTSGTR